MSRRLIGLVIGLAWLWADPTWAQSSRWIVVPEGSAITLRVGSPLGTRTGRFDRWTGDIRFDPVAPEIAQVDIEVDAASLAMDVALLTGPALGPAFLDSGRYPRVGFRLLAIEPLGEDRFTARAELTLKGITRPLVFPLTLRSDGGAAQVNGEFSLDRADFGIGTGGPWNGLIGRQVRVDVSLATRPAG